MFHLIRIGEQIGSGIPKVISSWKNQHWQLPEFKELVQPGFHTILTLKMTDYLPPRGDVSLTRAPRRKIPATQC